jgi:1-phosphofructokinase/tagatose 6-phosphate kinase
MTLPTGAVATVGDDGARHMYRVAIEQGVVETVSSVGAGDSFLAGYVSSRYGGRSPDECLRFAVACGAESVQHFGAGVIDPKEVGRLLDEVRVEELSGHAVSSG